MTRSPTTFLWELTDFLPAWTGLECRSFHIDGQNKIHRGSNKDFSILFSVDAASGGMSEFKTCKIRNDRVASLADLVLVPGTQSRILSLNICHKIYIYVFLGVCFKRSDCIRGKQMKIIL